MTDARIPGRYVTDPIVGEHSNKAAGLTADSTGGRDA